MAKVVAKEFRNEHGGKSLESLESLMRRFKRKVANDGTIQAMKEKEYYVTRGERRRREKESATRRAQRNAMKQQLKDAYIAGRVHLTKTQMKKLDFGGRK